MSSAGFHEHSPAENGNEVITRRKEQNLIEKTENIQIDKTKALDKKDILIPKAHEPFEIKEEILAQKREQMARLRQSQPGFVHFTDACVYPDPERYELEDEDVAFLRRVFPKELKVLPAPAQLAANPIVSDFVKLIEYVDATRDFSYSAAHISSHRYSPEVLEKVSEHWRYKTAKSKYPLLRKFWKSNTKKTEFGELDPLRVAFREREKERMRLRKIMKLTDHEILEKLEQLKAESEISLVEAQLILAREQLKNYALQLQLNKEELSFTPSALRAEFLSKCHDISKKAEGIIEEFNPAPPPPLPVAEPKAVTQEPAPAPTVQRPIDNDMAFFISTLISELFYYGFELNDFKFESLNLLNDKIRKIKRANIQSAASNLERVLSFGASPPPAPRAEPEGLVLCKVASYANPAEVFIEKIPEESFPIIETIDLTAENFTQDFLAKRSLEVFKANFSMFRVPHTMGQNPYVFCGNNAYSGHNNFAESIKLNRYNKRLAEIPVEGEVLCGLATPGRFSASDGSILNTAKKQVDELKFEARFKNFMSNKRIK